MTQARSLAGYARAIVVATSTETKADLAAEAASAWRRSALSLSRGNLELEMPGRPGRPVLPELLPPRDMPRRSRGGTRGQIALIHALAHIELNAVDLTWDQIGRFDDADMPRAYWDDFVRVGADEARHFRLLSRHLADLGSDYGDLPAHDGLWEAAAATGHSLLARLAIIPLVLEARGLDVTPPMIDKALRNGDTATADILGTIYQDEKRHVSVGARWFRFLCRRDGKAPEPVFHRLVRQHFRGALKPPFNDRARSEAGLTPGFYKPLAAL